MCQKRFRQSKENFVRGIIEMRSTLLLALLVLVVYAEERPSVNETCGKEVPLLEPGSLNFTYWDRVVSSLVTVNATIDGVTLNSFDYTKLINNSDYATFKCQVKHAIGMENFTYTEWRAFWINVYNYLAVRVVFENTCATDLFGDCRALKSIKEIFEQQPSLFDVIWSTPVLEMENWNDGQSIALNDIENNYLRAPAKFVEDVRIHGCIVCASVSCPDIRENAYTVENLEEEMDDNVKRWLANPLKGSSVSGSVVTVSSIFDWFSDDFNNVTGRSSSSSVADFLKKHGPPAVQKALGGSYSLTYFKYNWNLNGNIQGMCKIERPCFPWWALLCLILGILVVVVISVLCVRKRKESGYTQINT